MTPLLHGNDAHARFDARDQTVDRDSDAIEGATMPPAAATSARFDALVEEIFDKRLSFVLDIKNFSSIIYIWYEGGQLRPALVRLGRVRPRPFAAVAELSRNSGSSRRCGRCTEATSADFGRACQAAAVLNRERSRMQNPHEGGDNRQWRRKPRAGRRRPARNGKPTSPVDKRGRPSPPFQFFQAASALG